MGILPTQLLNSAGTAALAVLASSALVLASCSTGGSSDGAQGSSQTGTTNTTPAVTAERMTVQVQQTHPWDATSFTQGLETTADGQILVGTGMEGQSRIYKTTLDGQQSLEQRLPDNYFGEGLTIHGNTIWQLTWKNGVAIKRDGETLAEVGQASYDGEGWGICSTGEQLVMSNGSGTLTLRDPETFAATGTIPVTLDGQPTTMLNELECDQDGAVWSNVWLTDTFYRIDLTQGVVTHVVDTAGKLPAKQRPGADVLNGIALVPGTTPAEQRLYLTGKYWSELYEVTVVPAGEGN